MGFQALRRNGSTGGRRGLSPALTSNHTASTQPPAQELGGKQNPQIWNCRVARLCRGHPKRPSSQCRTLNRWSPHLCWNKGVAAQPQEEVCWAWGSEPISCPQPAVCSPSQKVSYALPLCLDSWVIQLTCNFHG